MAQHIFKEGKMMSNHADTYLAGAVLGAEVYDGTLVTLGNLVADTTYAENGDYEYDCYSATQGTNATADAIVDLANVSEGDIAGNHYKLGHKLYDLKAAAGEVVRVRRLALHDKFWLGEGNISATELTAGKIETAKFDIKILFGKDLTVGNRSFAKQSGYEKIYLCEVVDKVGEEE